MTKKTKGDIVSSIHGNSVYSKSTIEDIVNQLFDTIADELISGNKVYIANFATLDVTCRKAHIGRNPRTNQPMKVRANNQVRFRTALTLKKAVSDTTIR